MIKIKLYEYQVHKLLILLNGIIYEFKVKKEKPENACILSFYEIKISMYEKIKDILVDSLNRE